jgi:hypothetical protein
MKLTGKVYKIIYLMNDGRRVSNPAIRFDHLNPKELEWINKNAEVESTKPLRECEYGIHWFGSIKDAMATYNRIGLRDISFDVTRLELYEATCHGEVLIWYYTYSPDVIRGCCYRMELGRPIAIGTPNYRLNITWERVRKHTKVYESMEIEERS